jgi:VWFA-related protein
VHFLRRPLFMLLLGCLAAGLVAAQQTGPAVFKSNARIVELDVVVSGKNHRPLTGLHQQDFVLLENGQQQTISHFEEHAATPASTAAPSLTAVAPDVYTNAPPVAPADSVTVLVLDSLNTPVEDQTNLRLQVTKYIRKQYTRPGPGQSMAVFTLTTALQLVQGFTDDPALLAAALNSRGHGGVQPSALIDSSAEKAAAVETEEAMREFHAAQEAAQMQQFMADLSTQRTADRVRRTLEALQDLSRYLVGFPGRKNVVWFTGAFPVVILPELGLPDEFKIQSNYQDLLHKTDALLAAAHVAVYPVSAEGVATDTFTASQDSRLVTRSELSHPGQEAAAQRGADRSAMDEIALETGGIAQYGTNSLGDALERATAHGSNFYTLTYTSTNKATDGRFRKIEVRLANAPGYQLAYRRGYYADNAANTAAEMDGDLLSPYLRPGLPDSTQIPFSMHITHSASAASAVAGDNANLKGPMTRYKVDFLIPAKSLQYAESAAGIRMVQLESGLLVFNAKGEPLNWILRHVNLRLDPARYALAQTAGVNLYLEIDAPQTATILRGGIYDLNAQLTGTLQIPLLTR